MLRKIISALRRRQSNIARPYFVLYIFLKAISTIIMRRSGRILSFNLTPALPYFTGYRIAEGQFQCDAKAVCLVLQGPLNKDIRDASLKFAAQAKKELGFACTVYSGPDYDAMRPFVDFSVPPYAVAGNERNQYTLQQASTMAALDVAASKGYKFSLKLRADAFITRRDVLATLFRFYDGRKSSALVVTSHQKPFYKYFLSDHLQFGLTEDLLALWRFKWNGKQIKDYDLHSNPEDVLITAPNPEWVLGYQYQSIFQNKSVAVVSDSEIGYIFPKYEVNDVHRFDWESSPHFGIVGDLPGLESNVSSTEYLNIQFHGNTVYEEGVKFHQIKKFGVDIQ